MRPIVIHLVMLASVAAMPVFAQPATPPAQGAATDRGNPAVNLDRGARTTDAPASGANSFTEGQARDRIQAAGYSDVSDLQKDDQGIWRGQGMRNGQRVAVALDYQGNVSPR